MDTPPASAFGPTVDVRLIYGPLLIGVWFNLILFGVLVTQQLAYFEYTRKDPLWMRAFVWSVFAVQTLNAVFDMEFMFQALILNYGGIPNNFPTLLVTEPLCVVIVAFPIQLFFLWRLKTLTGNIRAPAIICVFAVIAFAGGIWTTAMVPIVRKFSNASMFHRPAELWLLTTAITDVCIAVSLAIALKSKKSGFAPSDTVVDRIIRMTVQTGMLTALFSILDVVCYLSLQGETFNFMWNIPLTRLYANCLLSTLNARQDLSRSMEGASLSASAPHGDAFAGKNADVAERGCSADSKSTADDATVSSQYGGIRMTKVVERM
ncbi:hypothetical protein B0H12DRAFT_1125825 [Mycena haematopus]|nr:hypothetical protein B0H12DRAFT_1125825 [Mycena haematopus]